MKTLDDRIADACEAKMSSDALKALLDEVRKVEAATKDESEAARKIALNPAIRPAKVAEARKAMENADFRLLRMSAAAEKLAELHLEAASREKADAQAKVRAAAIAERDQLAKDLEEYGVMAPKIASLLVRLAANNEKIKNFEMRTAEMIARDLPDQWACTADQRAPQFLSGVRLPKFHPDGTLDGYYWPPPPPSVLLPSFSPPNR